MKIAYCDCFSGISGDMFLGALIDAGLPLEHLKAQLASLPMDDGYELTVQECRKGPLRATNFEVHLGEHHHEHDNDHEHKHHHHSHQRNLGDILDLIERSALSERVKKTSSAIFQRLAQAEARVHGTEIEKIHFHEVGAVDSIVDTIGAAVGLEYLGIERLYASALPFSGGQVNTQHGILPVPAPATLEVIQAAHIPLVNSPAQMELVTPTGAAILASLATFERPNLVVTGLGVGAGKRDLPWPNIMRIIIGESEQSGTSASQPLVMMETNIDDMNPEIFGHVMEKLLGAGALDVYMTPIYMKKNRPATMLGVIARRVDEPVLARIILEETSTFGLRAMPIYRYEAERQMKTVQTEYGDVPVKLKILDGKVHQAAPEYEVCRRLAKERGVSLMQVYNAALKEFKA